MSVPTWLTNPTPAPSAPVAEIPPPLMGELAWARRTRLLGLSLVRHLRALVVEEGDAADQARAKAQALVDAIDDHPRHGRNWFAKHGDELRALVAPFFPSVFTADKAEAPTSECATDPPMAALPDDEVEGEALAFVVDAVFPNAVRPTEIDRYYGLRPLGAARRPTHADAATRAPAHEGEPGGGANV